MIELLGRTDGKRRRLLAVERAARHVVGAAALQLYMTIHYVNYIDAIEQILDKRLRDHRGRYVMGQSD
jgi:hypothetical protein